MKQKKQSTFDLRWQLVTLVTGELVLSVLVALGGTEVLNLILPESIKIPLVLEIILIALCVGFITTLLLSRVFLAPIHRLQRAMDAVASGDFSVRLEERSTSADIRRLYARFNQMVEELGSTELLQSDFVANVSHEFKTPITAIEGYATLLQGSEHLEAETAGYVDKILFNTARLSGLVGNILLLSKLENQTVEGTKVHFRLDEQIRTSLVAAEEGWTKKDLELDVDLCYTEYFGAEGLLLHVWDNLISNAIKFNRQGGLLRLRLTDEGETLLFVIENDGESISAEEKRHIFDKFYQADNSHRRQGNGLGLSLVRRICTLCHATVCAEDRPEGGARFCVTLPKT